ncbi:UbiA family prenyltransferase [Bdellovibrio sp. KM01]|uniref:UbiA family prenyltransferase n=1 Tax=Bdellovibrio sp. KM01 TaxID=2748865 RepID=UPI0015E947EB|nr:UbiA family prenyltransferase [Bdellovibrio sp. KM01]QLY27035.1 UbiA family prenyltransferase [Bdellovibrio sp. KM01]
MKNVMVCDLDDCLIKTDLLYEQWVILFKMSPLLFIKSFFWLLKGRAHFKTKLAHHVPVKAKLLPYRQNVLDLLKVAKSEGKELVLASASPNSWVQDVANHLDIFNRSFGSTDHKNYKGTGKLSAIKEALGDQNFAYLGDHEADLKIWKDAQEIIAVNPSARLRRKIEQLNKPTQYIYDNKVSTLRLIVKQMRPHQWIKNALVFLPALAGHKIFDINVIIQCLCAFAGFSLAASFVYVLNDLLDLNSDRNHHTKKNRPFASGNLSIKWGLILLPSLLVGSALFAAPLPTLYSVWIATYLVLNVAYSLYLKQSVVVDIIILSMMYTLRIFAGSEATSVPVSEWLLSFSTLFFFSLACVKRYTEIIRSKNKLTIDGRGYRQIDYSMIQSLGVGSGLISILIILLYLQSKEVRALYTHAQNLWFSTPVLLFWISRIWILTNRDEVHDDPVVFAVKDKVSWACFALLAIILGISV